MYKFCSTFVGDLPPNRWRRKPLFYFISTAFRAGHILQQLALAPVYVRLVDPVLQVRPKGLSAGDATHSLIIAALGHVKSQSISTEAPWIIEQYTGPRIWVNGCRKFTVALSSSTIPRSLGSEANVSVLVYEVSVWLRHLIPSF